MPIATPAQFRKDAAYGSIVLAEAAHRLAEQYDVLIALNTDHCPPAQAEMFLKNVDTDTQYAFTRRIADDLLKNYDTP